MDTDANNDRALEAVSAVIEDAEAVAVVKMDANNDGTLEAESAVIEEMATDTNKIRPKIHQKTLTVKKNLKKANRIQKTKISLPQNERSSQNNNKTYRRI